MAEDKSWTQVVAGVIYNSDENKVLIGKRSASGMLGGRWEFPGGKLESGESPQEALKRELYEELGLGVQVEKFLFKIKHRYPEKLVQVEFYSCRPLSKRVPKALVHDELRWVALHELNNFEFLEGNRPFIQYLRSQLREP